MVPVLKRVVVAALGAAFIGAVAVGPAQAATGREYSEHVRACQQAMGFTGTHNPGVMHQGYSGWDPSHTC